MSKTKSSIKSEVASNYPNLPQSVTACENIKPEYLRDADEAIAFARQYKNRVIFSESLGYFTYDGQLWLSTQEGVKRYYHEFTKAQIDDAERQQTCLDEKINETKGKAQKHLKQWSRQRVEKFENDLKHLGEDRKELSDQIAFYLACRNCRKIDGIIRQAQAHFDIEDKKFDSLAFILNTPSGEVDLRTGDVHPHDPSSLHTKITTVDPSEEGMEMWLKFLAVISCDDQELIDYLQLIVGATLYGRVYCENLFIAYGHGKNGKSTFFNAIERVLGSYARQISAESLTTGRYNYKNYELAELKGARLVIAPELEEGTRLNTSFLKKVCSTDMIQAEKKYRDPFSFEPSHTMILYTNFLPRVGSIDPGTWRRLRIIPFEATIQERQDIKNYAQYLYDHAGGAVLSWAIEGAQKLYRRGFHIEVPSRAKAAIDQYQEASDWLDAFVSGPCCEVGDSFRERCDAVYKSYCAYCIETGSYTRPSQDFIAAMEIKGFKRIRRKQCHIYMGLRLK